MIINLEKGKNLSVTAVGNLRPSQYFYANRHMIWEVDSATRAKILSLSITGVNNLFKRKGRQSQRKN
jgi:hypothetical protein